MYVVVIITDTHLYRMQAENDKKYTIGTGKKDVMEIPELGESSLSLIFHANPQRLEVKGKKIRLTAMTLSEPSNLQQICDSPKISIRWSEDGGEYKESCPIPYDCQIHIGRGLSNDIVLRENYISRKHLVVTSDKGQIRIEDLGSTNGIYLNGSPVTKAMLKSGDVIDILELRIRCENSRLFFENLHSVPEIKDHAEGAGTGVVFTPEGTGYLSYHRSPRIRESLPDRPVTLSHVPNKPRIFSGRRGGLIQVISSGAIAGASIAMGAFSPAMLAMRAAMMVSPVAGMIAGSGKKAQKMLRVEEEERFRKYSEYISGEKAHIEAIGERQSEIINRENPAPDLCRQILEELRTALWERKSSDSDFLQVRMGAGYAPLCVEVKPPMSGVDFRMERDEAEEMVGRIIEETWLVDNVPTRLDLLKYASVGFFGTRRKVIGLIKNMLISLTTLHYYKDVRIVGIFDPEEEKEWAPLRWLPHIWDEDQQSRYLNFDPITPESLEANPIDESEKQVDPYREFLEKVKSILDERTDPEIQKKWKNERTPLPHYIFLFASRKKTEGILKSLASNDPALGISTLFLYDEQYYLPSFCQYIVNVDDPYNDRTATAFFKDAANEKTWFTMDPPVSAGSFDSFCRRMAAVEIDESAGRGQIPTSVTFLQCFGVKKVQELQILQRWKQNSSAKKVTAPLGETEGGRLFSLSLHRHCSHGLVAGMTGSGKSELLVSWILSVACNYHPQDVSFVVIDYKGGSTAYAVEKLPHTAGIVTDSGSGIDRCFQSLEHELRRREEIFAACEVNNITEYIDRFHKGDFKEVLPRLIIVFDEFKELIKERPAVKKMVDSIAAKGSSLGVHLVLATQSPADAVDEGTWNNTQYQICMKVQNASASKVMIHEPDAALITQAGRAYVRVGTSEKAEVFELIQSAWSGAPYNESQGAGGLEVRLVLMDGRRVKTVEDNRTRFVSNRKEIDAVISYIAETAERAGIRKNSSPWKPDIPARIAIQELPLDGGFDGEKWNDSDTPWMSVPVGIYDRPELQDQGIQYLNFTKDGNYGIFGGSRSGKTMLLRTITTSLCRLYSPKDVNIYIIGDMAGMEAFPQVGGTAGTGQDEKLDKLIRMLEKFVRERRELFSREHVDSLKAYRELVSEDLPAIVVLIDRFSGVLESYPDYKDVFVRLFSEGPSKGVYFAYTGVNNTGVPYKLTSSVTGALSFMQADRSEYSALIGQPGERPLPDRTGCALIRDRLDLIRFQAALYEPGENDQEMEMNRQAEAGKMSKAWDGPGAAKIPVLPDHVALDEMVQLTAAGKKIAIGYQSGSCAPAYLDPAKTTAAAVMGGTGCGKTTMLRTIAQIIKEAKRDTLLFCVDTESRGLFGLVQIGAQYAMVSEESRVSDLFQTILAELNNRMQRKQQDLQADMQDPMIVLLIDDIVRFSKLSDELQMYLHRMMRKTLGYGMLVLCGIRTGDLFQYYTQDQLGLDLKQAGVALAMSDTAASYEGCYSNAFNYKEKSEKLQPGFGLLYCEGTCIKIKCVDAS